MYDRNIVPLRQMHGSMVFNSLGGEHGVAAIRFVHPFVAVTKRDFLIQLSDGACGHKLRLSSTVNNIYTGSRHRRLNSISATRADSAVQQLPTAAHALSHVCAVRANCQQNGVLLHVEVFPNVDVTASKAPMGGIPIMRGVGTVHHDPRVSPAGAAELACCGRPRHGVRQLRHASSSHPHTGSAAKRRVCRAVQQSVDEHTVGSHDASGSSSGVIAPLDDVAVPAGGLLSSEGAPKVLSVHGCHAHPHAVLSS